VALLLFAWFGQLTVHTRSLLAAWIAHAACNISLFLPQVPFGVRR
jgi:hypothetical protein